ncbi:hypothetical protein IB262_05365 [Ensifer sp. ENS02]|uniref:hypothetical protein n=1 Tax=Ensifer sp. ENS02 TaxID=2769290 RepID=UPI00177EBC2B|nr:hypothetical protein [Ensifer sp. ENS02]MBD9519322.1 hypothetical protein [Ensifer sp. ENS02]
MSWKTKAENEADKLKHGTKARGERHGSAKLTEQQVRSMRALKGLESNAVIAQRYGISERQTKLILNGGSWSWL